MKNFKIDFFVLLVFITLIVVNLQASLGNKEETKVRVNKVKQSVVKVLIDNTQVGTGFLIDEKGTVLTNFHVIVNEMIRIDSKDKIVNKFTIITYDNDTFVVDLVTNLYDKNDTRNALRWDYFVLHANLVKIPTYISLGGLKDAYEGATVYTCGFPLDLNEPFLSVGTLTSYFFKDSVSCAWVDITTNKGNSGGPLVLVGENPEDDIIIGMTSFIVTPYFKILETLSKYAFEMKSKGNINIGGVNYYDYISLINEAIISNSVGISGCYSTEMVKKQLEKMNK